MSSQTVDKLTSKVSSKVKALASPTTAKQLAQTPEGLQQSSRAEVTDEVGSTEAAAGQAGVVVSSPVARAEAGGVPWLWMALAAFLLVTLLGGLWSWRRKRKRQPAAPKAASTSEFDALADWNQFRAKLAPKMRRVLDDFQPVIVLGDVASEKHRVIRQLAGVEDSVRLHGSSAVFEGKALDLFLGDCTLIVAPTEEFCRLSASFSDARWQGVLRRVGRVRSPRVVVCISSAAIDLGGTLDLTDWMGTLRQHVSLVAAVRGEDVEVHAVLAQPPNAGRASVQSTTTEVLFDLVAELTAHDGSSQAQRVELASLATGSSEEERRAIGQQWAESLLWSYYRGWTKLLTRTGQSAENTLALVRLFERLPVLSSGLGFSLAELLADVSGAEAPKGIRRQLVLLPADGERLRGALPAFGPPEYDEEGAPWYPSARLRHRLWVTSGATLLVTLLYAAYHYDKGQWYRAATASRAYNPPRDSADSRVVEDYFKHRLHPADRWLPNFFDRDLPRFVVVDRMRRYLRNRMTNPPVPEEATPEAQLQLMSLFVTGSPSNCDVPEDGVTYAEFQALTDVISDNVEQWSLLTGFDHREISGYLDMACPQDGSEVLDGVVLQCGSPSAAEPVIGAPSQLCGWKDVPDAAEFVGALSNLSGRCTLGLRELEAIRRADDIQREIGLFGREHGAAKLVLDAVEKINHDTMRALARRFGPYRERLSAIYALAAEDEDMRLLIADVRPFLATPAATDGAGCADQRCTLSSLNNQLEAITAVPRRTGVRSLEFEGQTYVVNRQPVRDSLEAAAFDRLASSFRKQASAAESIFFGTDQLRGRGTYRWYKGKDVRGLLIKARVSPKYTVAGFQEFLKPELDATARYAKALGCLRAEAEDLAQRTTFRAVDDLFGSIEARLDGYAVQYVKEWRSVYDSFQFHSKLSATTLTRALDALSRPSSPQLEMFRAVVAQTSLGLEAESPFSEPLEPVMTAFNELAPVVEEAVFEGYRGLLRELLDNLAVVESPVAASAQAPLDAAAAREQFVSRLPAFGRAIWLELEDPSTALMARVKAWLKEAGVGADLQRPFLAPFRAAAQMGKSQLRDEVVEWWRPIGERFQQEVLARFPFARDAHVEVEVEALMRWLHPKEGKFSLEVTPIMDVLRACGSCRQQLDAEVYERARAIQAALFKDNGDPRALVLTIAPMPFRSQRLAPKKASLIIDGARYEYFNTEPRPFEVPLSWDKPHTAVLTVELADDTKWAVDAPLAPRVWREEGTPWSLFRVLERGVTEPDTNGNHRSATTFSLAAVDGGGAVEVTYNICAQGKRCDGLFSEVLKW